MSGKDANTTKSNRRKSGLDELAFLSTLFIGHIHEFENNFAALRAYLDLHFYRLEKGEFEEWRDHRKRIYQVLNRISGSFPKIMDSADSYVELPVAEVVSESLTTLSLAERIGASSFEISFDKSTENQFLTKARGQLMIALISNVLSKWFSLFSKLGYTLFEPKVKAVIEVVENELICKIQVFDSTFYFSGQKARDAYQLEILDPALLTRPILQMLSERSGTTVFVDCENGIPLQIQGGISII